MKGRHYPKNNPNAGLRETTECCPTLDYTSDQLEFMEAMRAYQLAMGRKFPSYSEVLAVLLSLGYRKVIESTMSEKKSVKVLIIEDNADFAMMVATLLASSEDFDYHVIHVMRFAEGKKELAEREYDIVILDIHLPDGTGTELVREARRLAPRERTAIIIATGYVDDVEEVEARKLLANDYLDKMGTANIVTSVRNWSIWYTGCREMKRKESETLATMGEKVQSVKAEMKEGTN